MKKLLALLLCTAELLLFAGRDGLRGNYREVEELLVIQTMGLDRTDSGVTLTLAAAGDSKGEVARMKADGVSVSAAMERIRDYSYEEELFCTHIGRLLLGEKLCEAGIESFGRGAEQGMDTVLIVVEPSLESVDLAATIQYMSEGLGIRRIRAIVNKVVDDEQDETVKDMLIARDIRFLGSLPSDQMLARCNLTGGAVKDLDLNRTVERLTALMFDEADMKYGK